MLLSMRRRIQVRFGVVPVAVAAAVALVPLTPAAALNPDTRVSVGSPVTPFSQNKQNEPALAVDANHPTVLAGGANDNIDLEACNAGADTTCPFTAGVGVSGVYFSFDSGTTWKQPTYSGWSARDCLGVVGPDPGCTPHVGPIGTLPGYFEAGLASGGAPAGPLGPKTEAAGPLCWANGSKLCFAQLAAELSRLRRRPAL